MDDGSTSCRCDINQNVTLSFPLAIGALYEIIEWLASIIAKGRKATKEFLGTQGDIWMHSGIFR